MSLFCLVAQAESAAETVISLPKGWEKLMDLGTTGFLISALAWVVAKFVIPRLMTQHEALVSDLLRAFREESEKAREYHERLIKSHEEMFQNERQHHADVVNIIVNEWRATREQLHKDATAMQTALRELGRLSRSAAFSQHHEQGVA